MAYVHIDKLIKKFGSFTAVDTIDLRVEEGEFISLLGPSGCGKTTTLRCIAGLELPTEGRIFFGERDVTSVPTEHRNIGMVFQNYALFPHMTIRENVSFGLEMRKIDKAKAAKKIDDVLEMVQLQGKEDRFPRELSGGQQQRVALARALVVEPDILLLDEPLANLDAKLRDEMRFFIRSLQQRVGITTIYVTHDQAEAMTMSDRIVVMFDGTIHQIGRPEEVYARPATVKTANFIGLANDIKGKVTAINGDKCEVAADFGNVVCEARPGVKSGDTLTIVLRPETIELHDTDPGNGFPARIMERHFYGNLIEYRISLRDGTVLSVQTLGNSAYSVRQDVFASFDENNAWSVT